MSCPHWGQKWEKFLQSSVQKGTQQHNQPLESVNEDASGDAGEHGIGDFGGGVESNSGAGAGNVWKCSRIATSLWWLSMTTCHWCIGKSIPDVSEISGDLKDFPRTKPEGNLEGRGDGFHNTSWVLVFYGNFLIINPIPRDQQIYPPWDY